MDMYKENEVQNQETFLIQIKVALKKKKDKLYHNRHVKRKTLSIGTGFFLYSIRSIWYKITLFELSYTICS